MQLLLLLPQNKHENEQNGCPKKPHENLIGGYYFAALSLMVGARLKRFLFLVFGGDHIVAHELNTS